MTKIGLGIGMAPIPLGDNEESLKRVFQNMTFGGDYWIVSHRELRTSLKVKSVFDLLAEELGRYLNRNHIE